MILQALSDSELQRLQSVLSEGHGPVTSHGWHYLHEVEGELDRRASKRRGKEAA